MQRALRVLDRSRRMVDGVYAFARSAAQPGEATTPLRAGVLAATSALRDVEAEGGPILDVQDLEEVEVKMDRAILDVDLSNLLSNALTNTARSPVPRNTVRARIEARLAHVEVGDTGPGVPEGFANMILKPYMGARGTTVPGLGLGLASVKRLVEGYGGARVGVRNAPSGRGPSSGSSCRARRSGRPKRELRPQERDEPRVQARCGPAHRVERACPP